ncbi:MAG: cysteine--tRNA ligase [Patescibacteria group bacterium]|nr:cysteine--tRNA ligase [Patescibacteria group bacterium]
MKLYNTLTKKIEEFTPLNPPNVTFYSCGPTVYDYTHIGHMRTYVNNDLLKRTLKYLGFKVKHVMNTTDVGHLTGDDDRGEDKMEKGAKKIGKTVWEVAQFYTDFFLKTIKELNIEYPDILCPATKHINEMINLIKILEEKGFTYETKEAVYFDVKKYKKYGVLSGQKLEEKIKGAREEIYIDKDKKNPADFALWFKRVGRFANHTMHWDSPWGDGFPGWHIECSAMSMKYLGKTIDIHAGGVDHIPVHHENEIAQSEAATGKTFVRFWFHNNFLMVDNQKMSKSLGNFYTLADLKKHNIEPLAIRYLFLQSHYRSIINFTWQSAKAAQEAFKNLTNKIIELKQEEKKLSLPKTDNKKIEDYKEKFKKAISNDLQIPEALSIFWSLIKSDLTPSAKLNLIYDFDQVFGLKLWEINHLIPEEIIKLANKRLILREQKKFTEADLIRKEIEKKGYLIEDKIINNALFYTIKKI